MNLHVVDELVSATVRREAGPRAYESVRYMFFQLLGRMRRQRELDNSTGQAAMCAALARADSARADALSGAAEHAGAPSGRNRRRRRAAPSAPRPVAAGGPVLCCSRCSTRVCRARDASPSGDGPEVALCDGDSLYAARGRCNVRAGESLRFSPRTHEAFEYDARALFCPCCALCLGVELVSVTHREEALLGADADIGAGAGAGGIDEPDAEPGAEQRGAGARSRAQPPLEDDPGAAAAAESGETAQLARLRDPCSFPSVIKPTTLFGSPRIVRPSAAFVRACSAAAGQEHEAQQYNEARCPRDDDEARCPRKGEPAQGQAARGAAPATVTAALHEAVLCSRYLSLRDGLSGAPLAAPAQPIVCARCQALLADSHDLLCTKRTWRAADRTVLGAVYVNALRAGAGCRADEPERVHDLAQGQFLMSEINCRCGELVGYEFLKDLYNKGEYKVGRFGLLTDKVALLPVPGPASPPCVKATLQSTADAPLPTCATAPIE
jgi:hypothetical protein